MLTPAKDELAKVHNNIKDLRAETIHQQEQDISWSEAYKYYVWLSHGSSNMSIDSIAYADPEWKQNIPSLSQFVRLPEITRHTGVQA
jgi:hypothetical protein